MKITVKDYATKPLQAMINSLQMDKVRPALGRAVQTHVRNHLFRYNRANPNKLGGKRTNFYAQAARATHWKQDGKLVIVWISHVGIKQRIYGGQIKPGRNNSSTGSGPTKFLTIPVAAEAHGKRASEFPDLKLVFNKDGKPVALGIPGDTTPRNGKGKRKKGERLRARWNILYVLRRSVNQKPTPEVIPKDKELIATMKTTLGKLAKIK